MTTTAPPKTLPELKLLQVLETCKQIPKDDRLSLRRLIKEGDEMLKSILSDYNNKKLQIKLRKYCEKWKQNRKVTEAVARQGEGVRAAVQRDKFVTQYRSNTHSAEKLPCAERRVKDFGKCLEDVRLPLGITKDQSRVRTLNQSESASKAICLDQGFSTQLSEILGRSNGKGASLAQSLGWSIHKESNFRNYTSLTNSRVQPMCPPPPPLADSPRSLLHSLKSILIHHYAEDIFDELCPKHFPTSLPEKSIYLPYRQLLHQLQVYLTSKSHPIALEALPQPLPPFAHPHQSSTLTSIGSMLGQLCLHRSNAIRGIFVVLGEIDGKISIDKFRQVNRWRGEPVIHAFQQLVCRCGDGGGIGYWQMYRYREQPVGRQFLHLYCNNTTV